MNAVAGAIDECRALTVRMIEAAEHGDWQSVSQLDAARRPCFDGVDVAQLTLHDLQPALDDFRALMAMDGHLRDLAAAARQGALTELRQARGRLRGSAKYEELSTFGYEPSAG